MTAYDPQKTFGINLTINVVAIYVLRFLCKHLNTHTKAVENATVRERKHTLAMCSSHLPNDTKMSNIGGVSKNVFGSVRSPTVIAMMMMVTE